jgi:hypothetical protein
MSLQIQCDIEDLVSPKIERLINGLSDTGRETLNRSILNPIYHPEEGTYYLTKKHLLEISETRHDTANRLGARPSGFWGLAVESIEPEANADSASMTIKHPGIGRVAHDVHILPTGGREFLTIPVTADAYNNRATTIPGLFRPKGRDFLATNENGQLKVWYALVRETTVPQDRTLLPSDDEYKIAIQIGIKDYVDFLITKAA